MRQLKISKSITNRADKSLDKYLQDISREEMITAEEEVRLAILIKEGDERAKEKLVRANLRFVVSVSKQYQNQGLTLPDLINEGNLGLIKAAGRFDETRGFKFISYAVWWIRQSILQALAEQARIVRLPLNQVGTISKINKTFSQLEQEFERAPSAAEIGQHLEIDSKKVRDSMKSSGRHVSVDAPYREGEDFGMIDMISGNGPKTDDGLIRESLIQEIERLLTTLSQRERQVIRMFYGIGKKQGMTLDEIGAEFDLTRERVRQLKEKAIRRLRHNSRSKLLRAYLG
ncbi:MAG: RNA polymerase subunit sigma [Crocinitomicaceae bacterium]|nr:RNA polymerase subunit sigma [Crocinitomicaceae bacterium]|tara:strand:- start:30727 stop:31587 length:861 start_codon:yes stop_codon:yes gene_type:complete